MKIFKKIAALVITLSMILSLTGCLIRVNEEKNRNIVVATIDGTHEIKKGDFLDLYNYNFTLYYYYYSQSGSGMTQEMIDSIKDNAINTLINEQICLIEMDAMNFQLNDEDREKAREDFEEQIQELADQYKSEAEKEAEENEGDSENADTEAEERDFYQEAKDYYAEHIKSEGMTEAEYIDEMAQQYRLERFKKFILGDAKITNDDIKKYYDEQLDAQKLKPNMDASVLIYEPDGVSYKYIKVMLTTEEQAEYDKLVEEEKTTEAADHLKKTSLARAEEYKARLDKGESFEDVLKDANDFLVEKCGVSKDDIEAQEEPLKLYKATGATTGFSGTLDSNLISAQNGEITNVCDASKGVYVIGKCYDRFKSTTKEYVVDGELYNQIKDVLLEEYVTKNWDAKFEELKAKHTIQIYANRLNKDY